MVPVNEKRGGGEDTAGGKHILPHSSQVPFLLVKGSKGKRKDALAFFDLTLSNELENKVSRFCLFIEACSEKNTENAIL